MTYTDSLICDKCERVFGYITFHSEPPSKDELEDVVNVDQICSDCKEKCQINFENTVF